MLELKLDHASARPRVLVVSDVLLYREGVARGLDQTGLYRVVGASSGAEAVTAVSGQAVDVVLLDVSEQRALSVARTLRARSSGVPVVGFGIASDDFSIACAEAGVRGFVGREGAIADLSLAVDRALAGEVLCSARLAALLCDRLFRLSGQQPEEPASPLTRREYEIAQLVAHGLSNKEIAIELRIGPATVKNHIHAILEKLHVARRSGIAAKLGTSVARTVPARSAGLE